MNIPKIIPGTFTTTESLENRAYREEVKGNVKVEFEGQIIETEATIICGLDQIEAHGFVGNTKTGKYKNRVVSVSYRVKSDEHDCRMGGSISAVTIRFDPTAKFG